MRRLFNWLPLVLTAVAVWLLSAGVCFGVTTIPVTGHVGDASAGIPPGLSVKFELYNCGSNIPRIPGSFTIVKQNFSLTPDATGLITGTIYPNDLISCGGVTGTTRYNVTVYVDNIPQTLTACYAVLSTMGTLNLDTATPCASATPPPPPGGPYDATYNNLTLMGLLTGGNATFAGTVQANTFQLPATPLPCGAGNYVSGLSSSFQVICSPIAAFPVTSVFGRAGAVTAQSGDYSCAQVTGAICSLPTTFYQTVQLAGVSETQRAKLNLIAGANVTLTPTDNPVNGSTDITLAATGVDSATTCGVNGCYFTKADGTLVEWGKVGPLGSGALVTLPVTFPAAFPSASITAGHVSPHTDLDTRCTTGSDSGAGVWPTALSSTGFTAAAEVDGGTCPSGTVYVYWSAIGK